ncbi:sulfatase family protein [Desulfovibrio inopinatus]|uniref:sulfatase family protein n=1 Tax=Desulfovibrio inopinatus TaxID=102109 RepID=UPI00041C74B9|nr:sulfatase-like hydrolase/transferase [Desulfovibrio inopinatus]
MHRFTTGRTPQTAWELGRFSFAWWLFNFVLVLLPLDLLYRLQSLLDAGSLLQVGLDCAFMVLVFTLLALVMATAVAVVCLPFRLISSKAYFRSVFAANAGGGGLFLATNVFHYGIRWVEKTFRLTDISWAGPVETGFLVVMAVCIVAYCLFFLFKTGFSDALTRFAESSWKLTRAMAIVSVLAVVSHVGYVSYERSQTSVLPGVVQNNEAASTHRPNIVLVTFDALRASEMSLYGYSLKTTPHLDRLGQSAYVFDNMYSSCNWTVPSLSSLLTGKHPFTHNVNGVGYSIFRGMDKDENIAQALRLLGYNTAAIVANHLFMPSQVQINGFDEVVEFEPPSAFLMLLRDIAQELEFSTVWLHDLAEESPLADSVLGLSPLATMDRFHEFSDPRSNFAMARDVMKRLKSPFFLWVHVMPPHAPYLPDKEFLYTFLPEHGVLDTLEAFNEVDTVMFPQSTYGREFQPFIDKLELRYDEHLRFVDDVFGQFLDDVEHDGLLDDTVLMVSADHGESFERGFLMHGGPYLYQELIHVPLIVKMPGQTEGKRVASAVSHVDLAPTLLDLLGVSTPDWMEGRSFSAALRGGDVPVGPKLSMNFSLIDNWFDFMSKTIAVVQDKYKMICYLAYDKCELYNLDTDPGETTDLADKEKEIYAAMKGEIQRALKGKPAS